MLFLGLFTVRASLQNPGMLFYFFKQSLTRVTALTAARVTEYDQQ